MGYGTGFDRKGTFSFRDGSGRNVIIFGVDMSSSPHINGKRKYILILGKGPTQRLEHTLTAEKMYSINFTEYDKKLCLSLHYHGANSCLFVNDTEIIKFKAKDSEIVTTPLSLGNISKDFFKCRLDASVCINKNVGIMINADVNVKNWLTKEGVIKDLFGILVIGNVNVINYINVRDI